MFLCACKESTNNEYDEENRLREHIGQLENEYDNAKQNADRFRQDVDDYNNLLDELENYN